MLALLTLLCAPDARAWPAEDAWEPLSQAGVSLADVPWDAMGPDRMDLVGDAENPVGFWYVDDEALYLRMRISDTPEDSTGPYPLYGDAWGALIDLDDRDDTYDLSLVLASYGVSMVLMSNTTDDGGGMTDSADELLASWDAPLSDELDVASVDAVGVDGLGFGEQEDWFVSLRISRAELEALTGIYGARSFRVSFATGYEAGTFVNDPGLRTDLAGYDAAAGADEDPGTGWSDELIIDEDGDGLDYIEERDEGSNPADVDTDDDGLEDGDEVDDLGTDPTDADTDDDNRTDSDEVTGGTDPTDPDTDHDGYSDGVEADAGTDPLDPDDVPTEDPTPGDEDPLGEDPGQDQGNPFDDGHFTGGACATGSPSAQPAGPALAGLLLALAALTRRRAGA